MQVRELLKAARFFNEYVQRRQLVQEYENLIGAVNQAGQNQQPQNVKERLDVVLKIHRDAESEVHSPAELNLLQQYGALNLLGDAAARRIVSIFDEHKANPHGIQAELRKLKDETGQLQNRVKQLVQGIEPMLDALEPEETLDGEGRLWLYFTDSESVETIEALEHAAEEWRKVLLHFSRVHGETDATGRILHIQKASPLIIELAASAKILVPLAAAVSWAIREVGRIIKVRQEAEKLRQMKIQTQVIDLMLAQAKEEAASLARAGADRLQEEHKFDNDARNNVEEALKRVLRFIEGGGVLDVDVKAEDANKAGEDPAQATAAREIKAAIEGMRKEMKLLPAADPERKGGA